MIKTKIEFNKTKNRESGLMLLTKFISDTLSIPFVPVWDELTLYVDTYIIGWFNKDNHNVITFKHNKGVHRISGEYVHMLLAIGKEKLEELYSDAKKKYMAEHPDAKYVEFNWKKL